MTISPDDPSVVVRAAVRVGRALGDWRRRRVTAAQDAYIDRWKTAWSEGCHAGWQGALKHDVPYRAGPQRDAWSAGWHWAATHPTRVPGESPVINAPPERTENGGVMRAASGGAIGVAFVAAARWLWQSRRQSNSTSNRAGLVSRSESARSSDRAR